MKLLFDIYTGKQVIHKQLYLVVVNILLQINKVLHFCGKHCTLDVMTASLLVNVKIAQEVKPDVMVVINSQFTVFAMSRVHHVL